MRALSSKTKKQDPMKIFYQMIDNISEMIEICEANMNQGNNNDSNSIIYNYVMKNENGLVKIGVSRDVDFRKNTLEHAGGYYIDTPFKVVSKRNAFEIESMLHDYFSKEKKIGEWFDIDYNNAIEKTIEYSKLKPEPNSKKNSQDTDVKKFERYMYFSQMANCDEDALDIYVISKVLRDNNINGIKELIDNYVTKYVTEGGDEADNLFALYLLLYLKEKYKIEKVVLKNGLICSICGYTVYLEDTKYNFCECADFYLAVYEQTKTF